MNPSQVLFSHVVSRADEAIDLGVAALLVGELEGPVDVEHGLARLEQLAEETRGAVVAPGPDRLLRALGQHLFLDLGYRGNQDDYYDPKNSYLADVLERRVGIPITLSVLFLEVGRRLGLALDGVSFPGHFLVRASTDAGHVYLDPFHQGMRMTRDELEELARSALGPTADLRAEHLAPASKRQILIRIFNNLRAIFQRRGDSAREREVDARLAILAARHPGGRYAS